MTKILLKLLQWLSKMPGDNILSNSSLYGNSKLDEEFAGLTDAEKEEHMRQKCLKILIWKLPYPFC